MKEIDFLPEWYKSGKQRQISYRTQLVGLGGIFVVMMVWNFIATHSISKATAEVTQMAAKQAEAESASQEFAGIKNQVTQLQKKTNILEEIDSKIRVGNVLAEMSFLIDEKIVLSKAGFSAEKFTGKQEGNPNRRAGSAVRVASGNFASKEALSPSDVRFKVVINGVAADASDVAKLICKLEDSPYFWLVYPSFSRSKKINPVRNSITGNRTQERKISNWVKAGTNPTRKNLQVTEFEISCYLANYKN